MGNRKVTVEEFLERARAAHGAIYDYSDSGYRTMSQKVKIICAKHGEFYQTPEKHVTGQGCRKCGKERTAEKQVWSLSDFTLKANEVHSNKYDYSKAEYRSYSTKVDILCKDHGVFKQTPGSHLQGNGCPKCGRKGWFKPTENAILYVLTSEKLTKIGVTNNHVGERIGNIKYETGIVFKPFAQYKLGLKALKVEQEVLKKLRKTFASPGEVFTGSTECFKSLDVSFVCEIVEKEICKHGG